MTKMESLCNAANANLAKILNVEETKKFQSPLSYVYLDLMSKLNLKFEFPVILQFARRK